MGMKKRNNTSYNKAHGEKLMLLYLNSLLMMNFQSCLKRLFINVLFIFLLHDILLDVYYKLYKYFFVNSIVKRVGHADTLAAFLPYSQPLAGYLSRCCIFVT